MPQLHLQTGTRAGEVIELTGEIITIGSAPGNMIELEGEEVEPFHATLVGDDGDYVLSDQQTGSGTFVNGVKIEEQKLVAGDQVFLGGMPLLYASEIPRPAAPAPSKFVPVAPAPAEVAPANAKGTWLWAGLAVLLAIVAVLAGYALLHRPSGIEETPPAAPRAGSPATGSVAGTKAAPYVNSLGMKFVPVAGTKVFFSVWETRVQDYAVFAQETKRERPKHYFPQGPTHPAVNVTWEDAVAFCSWLSQKEGRTYRLPMDAEWSVAVGLGAEAGSTPQEKDRKVAAGYPWGAAWPPPQGAGNYAPSLKMDNFEKTAPVGSFSADRNGIYDLGGNVWEWCHDWYDGRQNLRVLRGGSWLDNDELGLRSSCRRSGRPSGRVDNDGFRCVLVVSGG